MRAHSAGSIRAVLPAAFISISNLISVAGGIAAAIAVGAFIGQALTVPKAEQARREAIATGGLIGFLTMIGLILFSAKWG